MFSIKFGVLRSVTIDKPLGEVYAAVSDFSSWCGWSPWLCQEPDCPVDISGDPGEVGHAQAWHGKRIGVGTVPFTLRIWGHTVTLGTRGRLPWDARGATGLDPTKGFLHTKSTETCPARWTTRMSKRRSICR